MRLKRILSAALAGLMLISGSALNMVNNITADAAVTKNRVSVHDPSIVKLNDGSYYIIGSHLGAAKSSNLWDWSSAANSNLGSTNTTFFQNIYTDLAIPEKWSNTTADYDLAGNMWAPDIIYNKDMGKYCMYLSVNGQQWNSTVVLCTADNIDGPYTYVDEIVYSGFTNKSVNNVNDTDVPRVLGNNPNIDRYLSNGSWNASYGTNAIDPAVFYDENGNLWMIYGSWFGGLYMLELDEKTGLRDYNVKYETKADVSDAYMGKKAAGGNFVSGEGPYIKYMKAPGSNKGYYYMFVSYGYFNSNGGYNMRIFRSENPDGPYVDQNGNSAIYPRGGDNIGGNIGERLMSNYQWSCNDRPFKAQGHNSALVDDDGKIYVIYHTKFDDAYGFHEVRVHQMFINRDGWLTAAPYEYTGETISEVGHTAEAVTGDYEFIFHTLNQAFVNETSADIERPKNIKLNADGTVTGDITGTWSMEDDTPYMTLSFEGVNYRGEFLVQADESNAQTVKMTFTATGNNTCVWGSKKTAYDPGEDAVDLTNYNSKLVYNPDTASGTNGIKNIGDTDLLSGVSYKLTNKHSGKVLDLENGNTADGSNIQQWSALGGSPQEWRIIAEDNGYCRIVSMADESKCMSVQKNSAEDGLNVELQAYTGADNQLWKLVQDGGYYGIVSKCSGDKAGLDVYDWSIDDGGNINQWEYWGGDCQMWSITPARPKVNSGSYTLRNVNSSKWIAAESSGNVIQSDNADVWNITENSDGTYSLLNSSGKALTVEKGDATDGNNISVSDSNSSEAQKFTIRCTKDGSYVLLTAASNNESCVDVFNISTESGANICQWDYWGGDGQRFVIEPASAKKSVVIGDVNADGEFTILDIVMMQKYLLGLEPLTDMNAGELTGDGRINIFDLNVMKRMLDSVK